MTNTYAFESEKRILKGDKNFKCKMCLKIKDNNLGEILSLAPELKKQRLMEFAQELVQDNNLWHFPNKDFDFKEAEKLVNEVLDKMQSLESEPDYNAYINYVRASAAADQITNDDTVNSKIPNMGPGTNLKFEDFYIERLSLQLGVDAKFEVHNVPVIPVIAAGSVNPKPTTTNNNTRLQRRKNQ